MNIKYSYKDFLNQDLTNDDAEGFTGDIEGSCFYRETLGSDVPPFDVFPSDMTGVTFKRCNLDNCVIPDGNTVEGGDNRLIKVQSDGEDWVLDDQKEPVEPVNKKGFIQEGKSIDLGDL